MDKIYIRDLLVRGIVGINEDERINQQDIVVNLVLKTELHRAGDSDDIADCVNYRSVTKDVIALIKESSYFLVEKLATEIAKHILAHYASVQSVKVSVDKPGALRFAKSVAVEIKRSRSDFE